MTAPLSPVKGYVLAPPQTVGAYDVFHVTPNGDGFVKMKKGVNTCIVTWDGPSPIAVHYIPDGIWDHHRQITTIPAAAANTPRRFMTTIAAETDECAMFLYMHTTESDLAYRAGVQIINPANI